MQKNVKRNAKTPLKVPFWNKSIHLHPVSHVVLSHLVWCSADHVERDTPELKKENSAGFDELYKIFLK